MLLGLNLQRAIPPGPEHSPLSRSLWARTVIFWVKVKRSGVTWFVLRSLVPVSWSENGESLVSPAGLLRLKQL